MCAGSRRGVRIFGMPSLFGRCAVVQAGLMIGCESLVDNAVAGLAWCPPVSRKGSLPDGRFPRAAAFPSFHVQSWMRCGGGWARPRSDSCRL